MHSKIKTLSLIYIEYGRLNIHAFTTTVPKYANTYESFWQDYQSSASSKAKEALGYNLNAEGPLLQVTISDLCVFVAMLGSSSSHPCQSRYLAHQARYLPPRSYQTWVFSAFLTSCFPLHLRSQIPCLKATSSNLPLG
ncbi:hypothetical protein AMATHDRAFT_62977 [Amanita thiersii Skay4041]|uniref:Uncharacterized protein n=1 Tax=Amanita thiersii Skay4041 TaxID=703135 RepID=A0A2A9NPB1_9AGAR|nr:hypothetical protein AMATHDRAFT_62977 [Amanita thiersii Skay4041]